MAFLHRISPSQGKCKIPRTEINKLIGQVFIHRAAVNLLSTVLDTPEFFWSAPDSLQVLYKKVCVPRRLGGSLGHTATGASLFSLAWLCDPRGHLM